MANQVSSAIILVLACWTMRRLFLSWIRAKKLRQWAALGFLAYTVTLTAAIVLSFPDSYRLNLPWKKFLHRQITEDEALRQNLPQAPVRLLAAFSYISQNRAEDARKALADIDTRSYRHAELGNIIELWRYRSK